MADTSTQVTEGPLPPSDERHTAPPDTQVPVPVTDVVMPESGHPPASLVPDGEPARFAQATLPTATTPLPPVRPGRTTAGDESMPAAAVPVYPVRLPAPRVLAYDLSRGALSGTGELRWEPDGDRYRARMEGRIAGFTILQWTSVGRLDRTGLAPVRFTDRRTGGREQAANFVREDGVVRYSGPSVEHALPPAGQDRLSWMVQIAAVVQARTQPLATGDRLVLWVSGARGDADVWTFRVIGPSPVTVGGIAMPALALLREPRHPYDTRVEVWLDPAREHLPLRARLSSGRSEDALDLTLQPSR